MTDLLQTYLAASWRMTVVMVAWLVVRLVLRGRIPARLIAFGWVIILAGLLVPWRWPSALSPLNWLPSVLREADYASLESVFPDTDAMPADQFGSAKARPAGAASAPAAPPRTPAPSADPLNFWAGLWLGGAIVLAGLRAWRWTLGDRIVRSGTMNTPPGLAELVRSGARELALTGPVRVCETGAVGAPAICGWRSPLLLFPTGLAAQLTPAELRLVILHELGHWCRRDLWLHEAAFLVRALHWFNPLAWIAARMARDDAEAACDEFVMRRMSSRETHAYGAALLKVLGLARGQTGCPVGLGVFGNKNKLQQRIKMIAQYQRPGA